MGTQFIVFSDTSLYILYFRKCVLSYVFREIAINRKLCRCLEGDCEDHANGRLLCPSQSQQSDSSDSRLHDGSHQRLRQSCAGAVPHFWYEFYFCLRFTVANRSTYSTASVSSTLLANSDVFLEEYKVLVNCKNSFMHQIYKYDLSAGTRTLTGVVPYTRRDPDGCSAQFITPRFSTTQDLTQSVIVTGQDELGQAFQRVVTYWLTFVTPREISLRGRVLRMLLWRNCGQLWQLHMRCDPSRT